MQRWSSFVGCRAVVYSGRGVLQGVAEAVALGLMELARMPAFAQEGGQFQHGPLEMLGEGIGVVLFRPAGNDAAGAQRLVDVSRAAGCRSSSTTSAARRRSRTR